jgi:hypothetical protein
MMAGKYRLPFNQCSKKQQSQNILSIGKMPWLILLPANWLNKGRRK